MRTLTFSIRTAKEILRDPLNLGFGLGFPVILILLLSAIQANIPVRIFELPNLAPGIAVFGLSFMALFSATIVSKDRGSALLWRLYTTPLTAGNFILGYLLPLLPIAAAQTVICYLAAIALGLTVTASILPAILAMLPVALFFTAFGLFCGSVLNDKQAGGVCGALLTNLTAWLSGAWFDLTLVGGSFEKIANLLPFVHAVELGKAVLSGRYGDAVPHVFWVLGYMAAAVCLAVAAFLRQMKRT